MSSPDTHTHEILPADFNGDGLTDLLYFVKSPKPDAGNENWHVKLSTGKGDGNYVTYSVGWGDLETTEFALLDVDGNGTTDLVYAEESGSAIKWKYRLFKNNRFGTAGDYSVSFDSRGPILEGSTLTGDFNGDGKWDMAYQRNDSGASNDDIFAYLAKKPYILPTVLTKITDALGANTSIEYAPLSSTRAADAGFYAKGGTVSGLVTARFPYYAVKTVRVENGYTNETEKGFSEEVVTRYSYEGYRIDPFRGPVGFAKLSVRRPAYWHPIGGFLHQTDYSIFKQAYPYTGMVAESGTLSAGGRTLTKTKATVFAAKSLNSNKTIFPYVRTSRVTGEDLNGAALPKKVTETQYDNWGNATSVKVSNYASASSISFLHRVTNTNTYGSSVAHQRLGRLNASTVLYEKSGSANITRKTSYRYHTAANGYLLMDEISEPDQAALTLTKSYAYDGFGNITGVSASGSGGTVNGQNTGITTRNQVTTVYDSFGRFATQSTNAKGHTEYYYYDGNDLKKGRRTRLKGANDRETKYLYDAFNRLIKTTVNNAVPGGSRKVSTAVTRAWVGGSSAPTGAVYFVETKTDGQAPSIVFFNKAGLEISKQEVLIDGSVSRVDTLYTPLAQAYRVTQPFKSFGSFSWSSPGSVPIIDMEFDEMGRPKWQAVPDPGDADGAVTYFAYNGLKSVITNPLGQKTRTTLDENGNTVKVENNHHLASGASDRSEIIYAYDAAGNLISSTDAMGKATTMSYDVRGRKTQMNDPNMGLWKYAYNVLGELIWQKDAVGNTTVLTYDDLGRLANRVDKNSAKVTDKTAQWTYDSASNGKGRISSIKYSDNSHRKTFTYNVYGDLASRETTTDSKTVKETYAYDSYGRLTTTDYAFSGISKYRVKRDYSSNLGFLYRMRQDADSSGSTYGYTTVWEANAMDAWGRYSAFTVGNGAKTTRLRSEENGYLESIVTRYGSNKAIQDSTFVFDSIGNLTVRSSKAAWGTSQALEEFHYYDKLNRLLYTFVNDHKEEALQYDKAGNITARYGVGKYVYDSTQPNAVDSIRDPLTATTTHSYTYNANGAMTGRAGKTITWTPFNKPYQVKNGSVVLSQFRYGFDRERIRQDTPSEDIYYFGAVEWSWNAASTLDTGARIYLNAPSGRVGVHLKDASLAAKETRYFHTDHLGSIELVTNHFGEVVDRLSYTPWGQRRQDVWTHGKSFHKGAERRGFTGHEHLAYSDFELIHMNGRVYDPLLARFVSADPFADGLAASQTLNRYAYVGNNPCSFTDPSGHFIGLILGFAFGHLTTTLTAKVTLGAVIGGLQAAIHGGDWGDVLQGAALGGVGAGVAHGIGGHFGHNPAVFDFGNEFGRAVTHGLSQGGLHDIAGGSYEDGFLGGFFGSVGSSITNSPGFGNTFNTRSSRLFAAVAIGGTASELGGGKFGNGALSAAFVEMFNHETNENREGSELIDEAAEYGARLIMEKSNQQIEWGFGIYEKNGRFYITEITPGSKNGWSPGHEFLDHYDEGDLVAYLHSHPRGKGQNGEKFSGVRGSLSHGLDGPIRTEGDIGSAYSWGRIDAYLLTSSYKLKVVRLNQLPWSPVDFVRQHGYNQTYDGDFIKDLIK